MNILIRNCFWKIFIHTILTHINAGIQEKLGILNNGEVYAVFAYDSQQPDELSFDVNDRLTILRKGDDSEREWWWAKCSPGREGYVPRNLLGVSLMEWNRLSAILFMENFFFKFF